MSIFLLMAIFVGLLGVVVMIIYLIDRVNSIEKISRNLSDGTSNHTPDLPLDERFGDKQGRDLWSALSSAPGPGVDAERLSDLRSNYEPVLLRHIEELFEEGTLDARQGIQTQPTEGRWIRTASGQVQSWLPASDVRGIYDLGQDRERNGTKDLADIRARLDAFCERLFGTLGMRLTRSVSRLLLPGTETDKAGVSAVEPGVITVPQTMPATDTSPNPKDTM